MIGRNDGLSMRKERKYVEKVKEERASNRKEDICQKYKYHFRTSKRASLTSLVNPMKTSTFDESSMIHKEWRRILESTSFQDSVSLLVSL